MNNIVGILMDVSSSMRDNEAVTNTGLKELIRTLQLREDDVTFFYSAFGDTYYPIVTGKPLDELGDVEYHARGDYTALYYGVDQIISDIETAIANTSPNERPNFVTLVIQTDGQNMMMPSYYHAAREKIERVQNSTNPRWRIIGIGDTNYSGVGRILESELGIAPEWVITYNEHTTVETFRAVAKAILEESAVPGQRTSLIEEV